MEAALLPGALLLLQEDLLPLADLLGHELPDRGPPMQPERQEPVTGTSATVVELSAALEA